MLKMTNSFGDLLMKHVTMLCVRNTLLSTIKDLSHSVESIITNTLQEQRIPIYNMG